MINFVRAIVLGMCLTGLSIFPAKATSYEYAGNSLDVTLPCCSSAPGLFWSVTFGFNTFNYSGTIDLHSDLVTAFSGSKNNYPERFGQYFTLHNGTITDWALQSDQYGDSSFNNGGVGGDYRFAWGFCGGPLCYAAFNRAPGIWTAIDVAPVPAPMVGAGLPGLVLTITGFIGWRRNRRRQCDRAPHHA